MGRFLKIEASQFVGVPPKGTEKVFAYFTIAFPHQAVGYEMNNDESALAHLKSRYVKIYLEPKENWLKIIGNRHYFKSLDQLNEMNVDPDGFSGAPVFVVYQTKDLQCHFGLCGFVTDANKEGVMAVYLAEFLLPALNKILSSA